MTAQQPLSDRSINTHLANATTGAGGAISHEKIDDLKPAPANFNSLDHHRQVLQGKLEEGDKNQATYVSPSDDIMSPCSKKLSDLKGKRFKNVGKPQSLFAKLGKKNFEQSSAQQENGAGQE